MPKRHRPGRYVIGIDFGTLSARGLLVRAKDGATLATATSSYGNGVIEEVLPGTKTRLRPEMALQDPTDYLSAVEEIILQLMRSSGVPPGEIAAIGTDFTSCTVMAVKNDGTPLCSLPKWRGNPHAWVKLWKHHSAQPEADLINATGGRRKEQFLRTYGGKYSSEWLLSKILETARHAPRVYDAADKFIEGCDWIVWQLCGHERRNQSAAGFKGMWVHDDCGKPDYPSKDFFRALDRKIENVVSEKLSCELFPLASAAGTLTLDWASKLGLSPETIVCVGNIDAHAAVPACGVTEPGAMVMIIGTSTCHLIIGEQKTEVEGICGVVANGIVPGLWGYEAGQPGVGDMFAWFTEHAVPAEISANAQAKKLTVHELLEEQASALQPGESGLVALDWWNGNRSVLVNADLSGVIVGLKLGTRPHEIYRALLEATAFGTRKIVEAFESGGIPIKTIVACGGLPQKNELLMQIYADVLGRPIQVAAEENASAFGAAMHAAVAANIYPGLGSAAARMTRKATRVYKPRKERTRIYHRLYAIYLRMHDFFGREEPEHMRSLSNLVRELKTK